MEALQTCRGLLDVSTVPVGSTLWTGPAICDLLYVNDAK